MHQNGNHCGSDEDTGARTTLLLFVAGNAPRSRRARSHLEEALAQRRLDNVHVEIVDALQEPSRALQHRIFATPTLMVDPPADAILYGDLSDREALDRFLRGAFGDP